MTTLLKTKTLSVLIILTIFFIPGILRVKVTGMPETMVYKTNGGNGLDYDSNWSKKLSCQFQDGKSESLDKFFSSEQKRSVSDESPPTSLILKRFGHHNLIHGVKFTPDGQILGSTNGQSIMLWNKSSAGTNMLLKKGRIS
ncbi:MAG: hypothetical protein ACFFD4_09255 [Candidatus Odinarchaeota archaeon]